MESSGRSVSGVQEERMETRRELRMLFGPRGTGFLRTELHRGSLPIHSNVWLDDRERIVASVNDVRSRPAHP